MGACSLLPPKGLIFVSDLDDHSDFVVKVYWKHRFGKDKLVASLTDTIGGVLGKLKNGGTKLKFLATRCTDIVVMIKVLEKNIGKDTSDGFDPSGMTIKFALADVSREGVNADDLQVADAVTKANEGVSALGATPPVVGLMNSAVDTATNVVTKVQTFENTWGVLLQRMKLFNKIVAGIAQVFGISRVDSFFI